MIRNIILIVVLVALIIVAYHFIFEYRRSNFEAQPAELAEVLPAKLQSAYLTKQAEAVRQEEERIIAQQAAEEAELVATFRSSGDDSLILQLVNQKTVADRFELAAGTVFQSFGSFILLIDPLNHSIEPGDTREINLRVVPLGLDNQVADGAYRQIEDIPEQLQPLAKAIQGSISWKEEDLRLAAIILFNNPALGEVADFPVAESIIQTNSDTPAAARRSALELINALLLLKDLGIDTAGLKLAGDTQLQLETMVKENSNLIARKFYGLENRLQHWNYWKSILVKGDGRFRHYSLYGIGRFFPDVALKMMPDWAKNRRITPIYRLSAVYALGLTEKTEALQQLESLSKRYPPVTNMGRATREAARYIQSKGWHSDNVN